MQRIDLGGSWKLYSTDKKFQFDDAQVPGSFFYELEKSGFWGEHTVFYRENNRQCVELAARDFIYERQFYCPAEMIGEHRRLFLEADGLDTIASPSLNQQPLGTVENMHRRWVFPVTDLIKSGDNHLSIHFANTIKVINEREDKRQLWQVGTPVRGAMHLRKNYCSFGWDWGPQIPDIGIYRDIRVASYFGAKIQDFRVTQEHVNGKVKLNLRADLEKWSELDFQIYCVLTHPDGEVENIALIDGENTTVTIDDPKLWWPNGYGGQALYSLKVELSVDGENVDSRSLRIGLRTLRLQREKDQWGESFQFQVNGVAIFACGANYIPEDIYLTRTTRESTQKLLQAARDANFNCLRIWGGGIYPSDTFFDLADEQGLIIWQDMMFACAIYDVHNPEFYNNIAAEVRDNLLRLRHHASLGLICGNNEMEWAFENWGFPHTKEHRVEYIKQYEVLIPSIVADVCPEIDYWPASPSSGGHFNEPNHPDRGDVHYWDVWHGRKNYTEFRKHKFRFLSEFGFQSFPSIKTIRSFTAPEDRNIFSSVMEDHQRNESENGNAKIFHFIADYYRYPKDFESILYISQCSQSEALRYAVEHMRQNRGQCMGSTYWQLNDIWPVTSWSSIDYFGRWKAMHYSAKRVYDQLLLSIREEGEQAQIHLSNERLTGTYGTISWRLMSLSGEVIKSGEKAVEVSALSSSLCLDLDFKKDLADHLKRERYLSAIYTEKSGTESRNLFATACFVPYKHLELEDPKLDFHLDADDQDYLICVSAQSFAKFVMLDCQEADLVYSDNFFDLDAGQERIIRVAKTTIDENRLKQELVLRSVYDSYAKENS
ncbi:MAG: beta-mannosidase [Oligoflexus sp.]